MPITFVGQAQSKSTADSGPFTGVSAKRLAGFLGVTLEEFHQQFQAVNLLAGFPGKAKAGKKKGRGDAFDLKAGKAAAAELLKMRGEHYVCLGGNVARAFGVAKQPMLAWQPLGESTVAWMPHTSGLNKFYNDVDNRAKVVVGLKRLLAEAPAK
jgi:uracil-DNA glycosylase